MKSKPLPNKNKAPNLGNKPSRKSLLFFLVLSILMLVVGNIICFHLNQRPLKPMTNAFMFLICAHMFLRWLYHPKNSDKPNI